MSSDTRAWYVLYTKPRNEKKVAERLTQRGYTVYCPLHKVRRQWSDRVKTLEEPLFRSYVFIQIEDAKRDEVFAYPGTVRYLFWLRRPAVVRQSEIATIQKWLGEHEHENIDVSQIMLGDYIRITSGQFSGEEAILLDRRNSRVIVQLKELDIQLSLSLPNKDFMAL
jgi:transcription antitermination factor NusG